jgi:aryl-alcohol dehydrogenase-like predicted oxidoreductase
VRYRRLGRTDLDVSEIGHGLWGMGAWSGSDDVSSFEALQLSLEHGCNFFDSAWSYGDGRSDRLLGRLLRANPGRRIIAASKIPPRNGRWPAVGTDPLAEVFPRAHVLAALDRIRAALGVDTVDLLQFHVWHDAWAADRNWQDTVAELKRSGRIRWFGISLNRREPANGIAAVRTGCVDVVQVVYNIFDQKAADALLPDCREHDVGVIARVPLDEGGLSGALTTATRFPPDDWRSTYFRPENLAATVARAECLRALLPPGLSLPEVALRFVLANPDVATTIVGMRKAAHVVANTSASDGTGLPRDLLDALRAHRWDR